MRSPPSPIPPHKGEGMRNVITINPMQKRIKIMHLLPSLEIGGMENGVVNLVNAIDRERFESSICCLEREGTLKSRLRPDVSVICLHQKEGIRWFLPFVLGCLFRKENVDIIHTHNFHTFLYGIIAARIFRIPVVIHGEHGLSAYTHNRRTRATAFLSRWADEILTVSADLRELLIQEGIKESKIRAILNGIDTTLFNLPPATEAEKASFGIAPGDIVIGAVGRLVPVKDHKTLIAACGILNAGFPRLKLLIIGDGPAKEELMRYAGSLALSDKVIFAGQRNDTRALYRLMNIFALSSLSEGMSNVILEAMASRLPVAATNVGDNPLLVEEGKTGLLVGPGSPELLAAAIKKILHEPGLAARMSEAGFRRVQERFSLARMVREYEAVYSQQARRRIPAS